MIPALALLATCRVLTVDRIEGEVVVLDWCGRLRFDAPINALPTGLAEGDRVRLRAFHAPRRARPRGHSASGPDRAVHPEGPGPSSPGVHG